MTGIGPCQGSVLLCSLECGGLAKILRPHDTSVALYQFTSVFVTRKVCLLSIYLNISSADQNLSPWEKYDNTCIIDKYQIRIGWIIRDCFAGPNRARVFYGKRHEKVIRPNADINISFTFWKIWSTLLKYILY